MAQQITLTIDLTPENLEILKLLAGAGTGTNESPAEKSAPKYKQLSFDDMESGKDKKAAKKTSAKDKKSEASKEEPAESKDAAPAITLTDVRAVALKLSKAGQQKRLKEIFAKYGAEKLSDISSDDYPGLMADLEAAVNE